MEKVEGEAGKVADQSGMADEKETGDHILVEVAKGRQTCDAWLDNLSFGIRAPVMVLFCSHF